MKYLTALVCGLVAAATVTANAAERFFPEPRSLDLAQRLAENGHWSVDSRATPDTEMEFIFMVTQQNKQQYSDLLDDIANPKSRNYGRWLTRENVNAITRPSEFCVDTVSLFLNSFERHGLKHISSSLNEDMMLVRAPVHAAERMLATEFHSLRHRDTGAVRTRAITGYSLPVALEGCVDFVGGVWRLDAPTSLYNSQRDQKRREGVSTTYNPQTSSFLSYDGYAPATPITIASRYNITMKANSTTENLQAVVSFLDQFYNEDDLSKMQYTFFGRENPINQLFGDNEAANPGIEAELDVQYLTGVGVDITTDVWSTAGTRSAGNEPFLKWIYDLGNSTEGFANVFSISYQDLEYTVDESYAHRVSFEFSKIVGQGATLVTGSGDWGTQCKDSCTQFVSDFPSSSPYMLSAGATYFIPGGGEAAIGFSSGGFSNYFSRPSYQDGAVLDFLNRTHVSESYFNVSGRAFPDFASVGANFKVMVGGEFVPVFGTSASTPTWAGILSLINDVRLQEGLPTLGWFHPSLYELYSERPSVFVPISEGNNQYGCCPVGFSASAESWTPIAGVGRPNAGLLNEALNDMTFIPALASF